MRDCLDILKNNISRLLTLDKRKPLKPAWLAKQTGIDPSYFTRIADGTANPTMDKLIKIAEALDCAPWELIFPDPAGAALLKAFLAAEQDIQNGVLAAVGLAPDRIPGTALLLSNAKKKEPPKESS
jgi:transcriptional regulator with XRE-family HTH domain